MKNLTNQENQLTLLSFKNKKLIEPVSSGKKIGKIDRTFFCPLEFLSFSRGVGS